MAQLSSSISTNVARTPSSFITTRLLLSFHFLTRTQIPSIESSMPLGHDLRRYQLPSLCALYKIYGRSSSNLLWTFFGARLSISPSGREYGGAPWETRGSFLFMPQVHSVLGSAILVIYSSRHTHQVSAPSSEREKEG